jgi:sulfur carrier protein
MNARGWIPPRNPVGRPRILRARSISPSSNKSSTAVITIVVNGETHRLDTPLTFAALLEQLGLAGRRVALERNGRIVPRSEHAQACVADGDRIEIVVAVGGG